MYQSPIEITRTVDDIVTKINEKQDETIVHACMRVGVNVDKDELLKALSYDRHQYEKGYTDGRLDERNAHRWIPIEERLPEQDKTVLVTVGRGLASYVDFGFCDGVRWWVWDNTEFPFPVTAWMPLPEPYRKETEDGEIH